jgi:ribosomal protein S26
MEKECIRCGKIIPSGHNIYCIDCAITVNREKYKEGLERRKKNEHRTNYSRDERRC